MQSISSVYNDITVTGVEPCKARWQQVELTLERKRHHATIHHTAKTICPRLNCYFEILILKLQCIIGNSILQEFCVKELFTMHGENFSGGKIGYSPKLFSPIFTDKLKNVIRICTDFSLFAKFFLANIFYCMVCQKFPLPKCKPFKVTNS